MIPIKNASRDINKAESPRKQTTKLSALAIGKRRDGGMEGWRDEKKREHACHLSNSPAPHSSITPTLAHFFSFHFRTTPCITPPISSNSSLLCTISARVSPVM